MIWIFAGGLLIVGIGMITIGLYFYHRAIYAHSKKDFILVDPHKRVTKEDQWYLQSHVNKVSITTNDGLCLMGSVILNKGSKWVVLVHGYMGRLEDMIPQAKAFYERGYHILLIDLRGHGKSEGDVIGFGYLDHLDLMQWIDFIKAQYAANHIILYGVSMGAATVMLCSNQVDEHVDGIIEDCGFSNLKDQLAFIVSHMVPHVPSKFLIFALSLVMKYKAGYRIQDVDCEKCVSQSKVPILFLHGERDGFIEIGMMYRLYESCHSKKKMVSLPKGRHASNHKFEPVLYWDSIDEFLSELSSI